MHHDQQRQLTSTWLNIMGAGIVSGGIVSQTVTLAAGASSIRTCAVLTVLCIATGCVLHLMAVRVTRPPSPKR